MSRDPAYLPDILNSARLVLEFAEGLDRADLDQDTLRQYAIVHSIIQTAIPELILRIEPLVPPDDEAET